MTKLRPDENPWSQPGCSAVIRALRLPGPAAEKPGGNGRRLLAALGCLWLSSCGGALGFRSVSEGKVDIAIPPGIEAIRIELDNGTIQFDGGDADRVRIAGGMRRAADSAEALAAIERVPFAFAVVPDAARPNLLVLRGPGLPEGVQGVLGVEAGFHVPAGMPLEVVVGGSGVVTVANRAAATKVSTGRGDLMFANCHADVIGSTGRGNVIAYGHEGNLDLHAKAGDMQALVRRPAQQIRLVTGRGNVQLLVPPSTTFEVDARAEVGRVGNGFGLLAEKVGAYSAAMVGSIGDGHLKVVLRSASGNISFSSQRFD